MAVNGQAVADGPPSGSVLREYVIEAAIGQGGYGVVCQASNFEVGGKRRDHEQSRLAVVVCVAKSAFLALNNASITAGSALG